MHRVTVLMCEPRIVAAFAQFDINGDGFVPMSEISTVLANTGSDLTELEVEALFKKLDANNDGVCDLWELCSYLVARHDELAVERDDSELLELAMLTLFHVDSDGMVAMSELRQVFCAQDRNAIVGVDQAGFQEMLAELGATEDGPDARVPFAALTGHRAFCPQTHESRAAASSDAATSRGSASDGQHLAARGTP